jgi:hypothetical protein
MMYGRIFEGFFESWWTLTKVLAVFAVLGFWKAVELIVWAFSHLSITIN